MSLLDRLWTVPAERGPCCWVVGGADPQMCREHELAVGRTAATEAQVGYVVALPGMSGFGGIAPNRPGRDAPGQQLDREEAS